jgi:hypothetical protein
MQVNLGFLNSSSSEGNISLNLWRVTSQREMTLTCYVRCPSRSGAKIFVSRDRGWVGPFWTEIVSETDVPEGEEILSASFPTVLEEAADYEQNRKNR